MRYLGAYPSEKDIIKKILPEVCTISNILILWGLAQYLLSSSNYLCVIYGDIFLRCKKTSRQPLSRTTALKKKCSKCSTRRSTNLTPTRRYSLPSGCV